MKLSFVLLAVGCWLSTVLAQWEPDQRLTNDPGSSKTAECSNTWTVAAAGDTVHVVWTDDRDIRRPDAEAYVRQVLWTDPAALPAPLNTPGHEYEPAASSDGGELFFVRGLPGKGWEAECEDQDCRKT